MKIKRIASVMLLLLVLSMNMTSMAQDEIKKNGLTASEMLLLGNENLGETYKITLELNSLKKYTGFSKQLVADPKNKGKFIEEEKKIDEVLNDKSFVVGVVESQKGSKKEYYRSVSLLDPMLTSEQLMDKNIFYGKMGDGKWMKTVTNPIVTDILEETEKELISMYATYADDEEINGKKYHVIKLNPADDVKKEITLKVMNKKINESLTKSSKAINRADIEPLLLKELGTNGRNSSKKYYINGETKVLEIVEKTGTSTITFEKMNIEITSISKSKYYDFNQPVNFPQIAKEDIQ